jgi:nucleoside-diphosphate-sugar epimerase
MSYKILVTGGAGYIGSVLVPHLLSLGNKVTVLDNFLYGQASLLECCGNSNFEIVRGDTRDEEILKKVIRDCDIILPLAALVGAPLCSRDKIAAVSTNRDSIKSIVNIASKEQKIIIPITNSGYGIGQNDAFCTEKTPMNPISLYGKTKVEAEEIVLSRGNALSLRLATVFGVSPRMRLDLLVNDFTYRAVKDRFIIIFEGHFRRNYIHVKDVVEAFIHAIDNFEKMKDEPYNIGLSEANLTKVQLCEKIKEQVKDFVFMESQIGEDPDKRDYIVSNEKIESTGYKPSFSLEMGIQELIKGYTIISNNKFSNV